MALVQVKVPDIGDFKDVAVIEMLVKEGETIRPEQSLLTVESDKASMEIPSSHGGVVRSLKLKLGDKVNIGDLILELETAGGAEPVAAAAAAPAAVPPAAPSAAAPAAAPATPAGVGGSVVVVVPDIGDFKDVAVIELLVKPGDTVRVDQGLLSVESDKASMEIPSPHAGVVQSLQVQLGDRVNIGDALLTLAVAGAVPGGASLAPAAAAPATATPGAPAAPAAATPALPAHAPGAATAALPHASPSVRKFARELGVPLAEIRGSGSKGRITQEDVQGFVAAVMKGEQRTQAQAAKAPAAAASSAPSSGQGLSLLAWPQVDFAKFGAVEKKPLSRIKRISGANLHRNWVVIPHVTNHDEADITELEAFRVAMNKEHEKAGVKFTLLAFLIKACVAALQKFPEFNASLEGQGDEAQLVLKKYFHIGFAADTPNGLVVPVVKDADRKGIIQIAKEMGELAAKARDGKLSPAEMSGGCFSISSLGGIGGTYFTPIINAPEVAILGVCKGFMKPVWNGSAFEPRLTLPLSLSWDHRVIDGASAARFNAYLAAVLADFRRVLL